MHLKQDNSSHIPQYRPDDAKNHIHLSFLVFASETTFEENILC